MPRLFNPTRVDLFAPQIHRSVPAFSDIHISDEEVALFEGNTVFRIQLPVEEPKATRRTVTRGGQKAEIDTGPPMETR